MGEEGKPIEIDGVVDVAFSFVGFGFYYGQGDVTRCNDNRLNGVTEEAAAEKESKEGRKEGRKKRCSDGRTEGESENNNFKDRFHNKMTAHV